MKLRTLILAVAILAALSVVAYRANRPAPASADDPRVGKPLLDADTVARAGAIVIADHGAKVEIVRGPDGAWRVASYYDFPADLEKVAHFVQDLNEAKVDRLVTSSPDRLAHLEFKDSTITLNDPAGNPLWTVTVGKASDSGNGRFIRFGNEAKAYYSGIHLWLDTDAKGWASSKLLDLKQDEIASVEVPFEGAASVLASRAKKDAPWTAAKAPTGKKLSEGRVSALLGSLAGLRFSDSLDVKDPGAAEAAAHMRTIKLTTFDGKTLTVSLGRKPEEKKLKASAPDAKTAIASLPTMADAKAEAKPVTPEFETTPAGPVFVAVTNSDAHAPVNDMMRKRVFQVDEYVFTGLPQKSDDLFESDKAK